MDNWRTRFFGPINGNPELEEGCGEHRAEDVRWDRVAAARLAISRHAYDDNEPLLEALIERLLHRLS